MENRTVKVYEPDKPLTIPQELTNAVKNAPDGSYEQRMANQAIADFISAHLSEMRVKEINAGPPKHIAVSKLPINARDKPIGRKDWLHKK